MKKINYLEVTRWKSVHGFQATFGFADVVYLSSFAPVTKYTDCVIYEEEKLISHSSGVEDSKIKAVAGSLTCESLVFAFKCLEDCVLMRRNIVSLYGRRWKGKRAEHVKTLSYRCYSHS
jgi:hypothetical protein